MVSRLPVTLAAVALLAGSVAAHAQTTTTSSTTTADLKSSWRMSKLMGLDVYNEAKEKIGDINEVLIDNTGNVKSVIVGVGGFLGVGDRNVAVPIGQIKFSETSVNASSTTGSSAGSQNDWAPDHAMMSTTKEQLKAMPEFKLSAVK